MTDASGPHLTILDEGVWDVIERDVCKTTWILKYQKLPIYYDKSTLTPSYLPDSVLEPIVESLPVGLRPD